MIYSTLISPATLAQHLDDAELAIVDCRFSLDDTARGQRDHRQAHIPNALYAHLERDLSGPVVPGSSGRHPLPEIELFRQTLCNWGIGPGVQVVAYDDSGGAIAARLWWMLRWLGHDEVAVLDGGWPYWVDAGWPRRGGIESRPWHEFMPEPQMSMIVDADRVETVREDPEWHLIDSRSEERYRGANETIDPIAGHIPGAISAPYVDNLDPNGLFRSQEAIRARFETLLGNLPPEQSIFYCGSGVSAAQNILAMAYAGFSDPLLYVGSWSEWITDPGRPITTG